MFLIVICEKFLSIINISSLTFYNSNLLSRKKNLLFIYVCECMYVCGVYMYWHQKYIHIVYCHMFYKIVWILFSKMYGVYRSMTHKFEHVHISSLVSNFLLFQFFQDAAQNSLLKWRVNTQTTASQVAIIIAVFGI